MSGWARHDALVADNQDPLKLGRIKVRCAALAGRDSTLPYWVEPAGFAASKGRDDVTGAGWFVVPEKGSHVILEVMVSHPTDRSRQESLVMNPQARYFPAAPTKLNPPGADFIGADYPEVRGFRTPSGHVWLFNDKKAAEGITVRHQNAETLLTMLPDGTLTVQAGAGSYLTILKDGTITLHAPNIKIDAAATQALVRGDDLKTWLDAFISQKYNAHIHPTGVGPSGVPTVPATVLPTSALSANHKVN